MESCAVCHTKIDPLGLALENYDAVGGWRTVYYQEEAQENDNHAVAANRVDASAVLPDGARLNGPADIKKYLLSRPQQFTAGLTTKLLEYATGRSSLSVGDRHIVQQIVKAEPPQGYGFQDLIAEVVSSEAFTTK